MGDKHISTTSSHVLWLKTLCHVLPHREEDKRKKQSDESNEKKIKNRAYEEDFSKEVLHAISSVQQVLY